MYPCTDKQKIDIENRFSYHPPRGDQPRRYITLCDAAKALARLVLESTPPSREQSLALTKLEEAVMWANASIARNESSVDLDLPGGIEPHPIPEGETPTDPIGDMPLLGARR